MMSLLRFFSSAIDGSTPHLKFRFKYHFISSHAGHTNDYPIPRITQAAFIAKQLKTCAIAGNRSIAVRPRSRECTLPQGGNVFNEAMQAASGPHRSFSFISASRRSRPIVSAGLSTSTSAKPPTNLTPYPPSPTPSSTLTARLSSKSLRQKRWPQLRRRRRGPRPLRQHQPRQGIRRLRRGRFPVKQQFFPRHPRPGPQNRSPLRHRRQPDLLFAKTLNSSRSPSSSNINSAPRSAPSFTFRASPNSLPASAPPPPL